MIKVTIMGQETKDVEYQQGMKMKIYEVIELIGLKSPKGATITVDGKEANLKDIVADSSHVVITPKIKQG